jgi:hypothetical protein
MTKIHWVQPHPDFLIVPHLVWKHASRSTRGNWCNILKEREIFVVRLVWHCYPGFLVRSQSPIFVPLGKTKCWWLILGGGGGQLEKKQDGRNCCGNLVKTGQVEWASHTHTHAQPHTLKHNQTKLKRMSWNEGDGQSRRLFLTLPSFTFQLSLSSHQTKFLLSRIYFSFFFFFWEVK